LGDHGRATVSSKVPRTSALLRAKLRPPGLPEHYIRRQRLFELLDDVVGAPLTIVEAPAGAGKSLLLAGWMAESAVATAWLSLDEADHDGTQLWTGVIAALEVLAPGCGREAVVSLRRRAALTNVVEQLLDQLLARVCEPGVLILDDVHLVDGDEDVATSLGLLLHHLPPWLHVVLLSRRDLFLPVDRLRARGQLGEVRFAELRFSRAEANDLLSRLAPQLSEDQIDDTAERVAGWAAGLQMAALAARSHRAQQLVAPGAERELLVDDYVWHEVLAREDANLVDVLVETSVVDRVNPSLANALTGRTDTRELLERAETRGLFVNRIGVEGWFGVHGLVRTVLLGELARRSPVLLAERHARAARWFEDAGEVPAALEHWLLAQRPREALRLLAAEHSNLYDRGLEGTILRTIAAIPAETATADFGSMLDYAWCLLLVDRRRYLKAVEQATWWADHSTVDEGLRSRLTMLQSSAATMSGDWARGAVLAERAIEEMGETWWRDPLGRFAWNMIAREIALSERWAETCDDVRIAELALSRDPERRLALEGTRALGEVLAGRPVDALRVAAGIRRAAAASNLGVLRAELSLAEAIAHRELGDRSRALSELGDLAETPVETMLYCRIVAILEITQAHIDDGELDAAQSAFEQAQSLIDSESFGPGGQQWFARVGTRLAVATGDIAGATQWAAQVNDPFWTGISTARVHLAAGNLDDAAAALDTAVPRCVRHEVICGLLRARVVADHDLSVKCATDALDLAAANELLQTVASEGPEALELVERGAWRAPEQWLERLRRVSAAGADRPPSGRLNLVEQLTDRERDVLRFLPSRLTVREIADELYVSVNTLKFHLKVIYRKLGVTSRAEAAAKARQLTHK
jgi:LuxR family transcriptional regulator, maltose regulon positive regulatory protein